MISSNLIDIEVMFRNNTNIKKKIMIDSRNINFDLLNRKILEVCEIFPKLSGLNKLSPENLMKKTENGEIKLKEEANFLKSKDIILFDLLFYEVWLDIQMTLKCDDIIVKKIKFELKLTLGKEKKYLDNILIKLGLKYFNSINGNEDYYIFTELLIENFNPKLIEANKINFNFDNELKCTLIFSNFSNYIYNLIVNQNLKVHSFKVDSKYENERKKAIKDFFNDYFPLFFDKEKTEDIAKFSKIIFKYNQKDFFFDDMNSSMIIDRNSFFGILSTDTKNPLYSPNLNGSFTSNLPIQNRNSFKYSFADDNDFFTGKKKESKTISKDDNDLYIKYKKDIEFIKEMDYEFFSLIRKLSKYFVSYANIDFFKLPDTKNLVEISDIKEEAFEIDFNGTYNDHNHIYDFDERYILIKKLKKLGIALVIFLIFGFVYYLFFLK